MKYTQLPSTTGPFTGRKPKRIGSWTWPTHGHAKGGKPPPSPGKVERVARDILRDLCPSAGKAGSGKGDA